MVGYAIFNTVCVVTAIVSGIVTKEWVKSNLKQVAYILVWLQWLLEF